MRKIILTFLLFTISFGYSQNQLNETQKLATLCKVWGFLKYYHPSVAKGNYNWDEQLIIILPKIEQAKTKEEISTIYLNWIQNLGVVKECKTCKEVSKKEYFDKNFNLSWTQDINVFTTELSTKLKFIEENRFQGENFYVATTSHGNIKVQNEPKYENFEFPNINYRLLGLFKYWNTVEYFFPYKYLTDQDWTDVLAEMIPKFQQAKNASEYHLAMLETATKIDDSHGTFKTKHTIEYFGTNFIPVELTIIENKAIVTGILNDSLSKINDLRIGDIIEKVNGKEVNKILEEKSKYISGSNKKAKENVLYYTLCNGNTNTVNLELNRDGLINIRTIKRYSWDEIYKHKKEKREAFTILENNIGYVNMKVLEYDDVDEMMEQLSNTKGIIIDIRAYPNFIPYNIARHINSQKKDYLKTTIPDLSYPGKFTWKKPENCTKANKDYYKGKIILLVNENTGSRGEYSTMCLQTANNVTTIGSQTWGADGEFTRIEFIGGYTAGISGTGIYYPDGTETQRIGVKVDVKIEPTIKGIREDKDEVLQRGIDYIKNGY
jgi:carboxyl-terminal processing protease